MIIIANKPGRLGNRLFVFAQCIATAIDHGLTVWNPSFDEYAADFPAVAADPLCRFPQRRHGGPAANQLRRAAFGLTNFLSRGLYRLRHGRVVNIEVDQSFDLTAPEFLARARRGPVFIQGWQYHNDSAVGRHREAICRFLSPAEQHLRAAAAVVAAARRLGDLVVGVHVRHGDYATFAHGRYLYTFGQYAALVDRVAGLFPNRRTAFVVCGNTDIPPTIFARHPHVSGPGTPVQDMYAFAACDLLVGPPSTFTMWASYHGRVPLLSVTEPDQPIDIAGFRVTIDRFEYPG